MKANARHNFLTWNLAMAVLRIFWRVITALIITLLTLIVAAAIVFALRISGADQADDETHLDMKRDYLAYLQENASLPSDAPNIVFILYDDLGYGDIGFGAGTSNAIHTPNINALAANGLMLSDFHSPAPVCTPSRAGYLTGRLAARAGLPNVVFPSGSTKELLFSTVLGSGANKRLPAEEITLAEVLQAAGYATGMVGKWHLGDQSPSLPNDLGFDSYYGALYSNDMEPFAFYRDREIEVDAPADQNYMTERYDAAAIEFIEQQAGAPFFLYYAHNFPHRPLFVREERSGRSAAGLYGDVMEEIDEGIGKLIAALKRTGQWQNTLLIITSDNGPWYLGDPGNLRGRKGNTFEGGMRVPFIAHWPAAIPAGEVSHAMAMGTDLLPTVLEILNLAPPEDRLLDGRSILGLLTRSEPSPHDYLYYYDGETLFAVRDQRFKYRGAAGVFYSTDQMALGGAVPQKEWLFDLSRDNREAYDTSDTHPRHLERLKAVFAAKNSEMAENPRGWR